MIANGLGPKPPQIGKREDKKLSSPEVCEKHPWPDHVAQPPQNGKRADTKLSSPQICSRHPWPDHVAQYNLIRYLARNNKYRGLRRLLLVGKDYIDQQLLCMTSCSKYSNSITQLVYDHIKNGWLEDIKDAASYCKFNDNRGQRTLNHENCGGSFLKPSVQKPFDESVILWHLATDFCFHDEDMAESSSKDEDALRCTVMSNYMAYLLFVNPDMLMPGARRNLDSNE